MKCFPPGKVPNWSRAPRPNRSLFFYIKKSKLIVMKANTQSVKLGIKKRLWTVKKSSGLKRLRQPLVEPEISNPV